MPKRKGKMHQNKIKQDLILRISRNQPFGNKKM